MTSIGALFFRSYQFPCIKRLEACLWSCSTQIRRCCACPWVGLQTWRIRPKADSPALRKNLLEIDFYLLRLLRFDIDREKALIVQDQGNLP